MRWLPTAFSRAMAYSAPHAENPTTLLERITDRRHKTGVFTQKIYKDLENHYRANALAGVHQLKSIIDLLQRHGVGDHLVDFDFTL